MGVRLRKRLTLAPGVRLNFSLSGISTSVGPRGASVSLGRRGTFLNTGLPGTGLYSRQRIGGSKKQGRKALPTVALEDVAFSLAPDGALIVEDSTGAEITGAALKRFREENETALRSWLSDAAESANADYAACLSLHLATPSPTEPQNLPFPILERGPPVKPDPLPVTFWDRLVLRRAHIEELNDRRLAVHTAEQDAWIQEKVQFAARMDRWAQLVREASAGLEDAMEAILEEVLGKIAWPCETIVSYELGDGCTSIDLDVDLPEIEDMPSEIASVATRGLRITTKVRTETQVRQDYAQLVHGIVFRIAGEILAVLPTVQQATISARTQRSDPGSGQTLEEYVISSRIDRSKWAAIDFASLETIDPVEALDRFELVRRFDRSRKMLPISPITSAHYR